MDEKAQSPTTPEKSQKSISEVLQMSSISLDTYDDIFSDFDPSPYESRLLSEDLIKELFRRYTQNQKGDLVVIFTIPAPLRMEKVESLIRRRIRDHFKDRLKQVSKELKDTERNGLIRITMGLIIEIIIVLVLGLNNPVVLSTFSVLSWYAIWSGLERLFEIPARLTSEKQFAEKFTKAEYRFMNQETIVQSITDSYL